ncbi:PAS domain-containing protein [bacterium]|nr:PAS domain-containing protein [bacterium]
MAKRTSFIIGSLKWVRKSLAFKLILWTGVILVVSLEVFFYLENAADRRMMINQIREEAYRLSDIIKRGTYHDMLEARSEELQKTLEIIGAQEDVRKVRIIELGRIKQSSIKEEVGEKTAKEEESCIDCHSAEEKKPLTVNCYRFFTSREGEHLLGFVNPIYNEEKCHACHSPDNEMLGVLDIVLSVQKVYDAIAANKRRSILFMLCLFLIIAISITLFILRFVNRPIQELTCGTRMITQGDLTYHIHSDSEDEIGELARSFNRMTDDLKDYQGQLIRAKEYIDNIIKSMNDSLVVAIPDGRITMVNQATMRLLRYDKEEDLLGQPWERVFSKDIPFFSGSSDLHHVTDNGSIKNLDTVCRAKEGDEIPVNLSLSVMRDANGNPQAIVLVARDMREIQTLIADLKRAYKDLQATQTKLIQSSRLAAMGELAAGIAHEVNNPVKSIINYADLLQEEIPPGTKPAEYVRGISKEGQWIVSIVKGLLSFAQADDKEFASCKIADIITTSITFINNYLAKDRIRILSSYNFDLPCIRANATQLEQVFINLLINARDALNEKYPHAHEDKVIRIEAKGIERDGAPYIRIMFKDSGTGIDEENLDKIFEPFFTTKQADKGTGLGLSIAYGIIEDHKGFISVTSTKGKGTTFTIDLPAEGSLVHASAHS